MCVNNTREKPNINVWPGYCKNSDLISVKKCGESKMYINIFYINPRINVFAAYKTSLIAPLKNYLFYVCAKAKIQPPMSAQKQHTKTY